MVVESGISRSNVHSMCARILGQTRNGSIEGRRTVGSEQRYIKLSKIEGSDKLELEYASCRSGSSWVGAVANLSADGRLHIVNGIFPFELFAGEVGKLYHSLFAPRDTVSSELARTGGTEL